jgi:hypothetical protein
MSKHELRVNRGDPLEGPLGYVLVYIDDNGKSFFPGDDGYVEPEAGSREFLDDQGAQLTSDQHAAATGQDPSMTEQQREAVLSAAEQKTVDQVVDEQTAREIANEEARKVQQSGVQATHEAQGEVVRDQPETPQANVTG